MVVQSPRDSQCSPQLADSPIGGEKTGSLEGLVLLKKVFIGDPEISIVSEAMVELLKPLGRPLFRAIAWTGQLQFSIRGLGSLTPRASPFTLTPGILELQQTLAIDLYRLLDRIGVKFDNTLALTPATAPDAGITAKEEFLVDFHKFLCPEVFLHTHMLAAVTPGTGSVQRTLSRISEVSSSDVTPPVRSSIPSPPNPPSMAP